MPLRQQHMHAVTAALERAVPQATGHGEFRAVLGAVLPKVADDLNRRSQKALDQYLEDAELDLNWAPGARNTRRIYALHRPVHPLELAMAFGERAYVSFATALFWNGLTDQVPANYLVGIERKSPTRPTHTEQIDPFYLREQFMKPYRETSRVAAWEGVRYTLLERDYTGLAGVTQRTLAVDGRTIRYACTSIERTLIDCAVFPHRSGGIAPVLRCYADARSRFTVARLVSVYRALNLTYPYWQRIGFILSRTGQHKKAAAWKARFGQPSIEFYLDKPYRADWAFDEEWRVHYAPGLFP